MKFSIGDIVYNAIAGAKEERVPMIIVDRDHYFFKCKPLDNINYSIDDWYHKDEIVPWEFAE